MLRQVTGTIASRVAIAASSLLVSVLAGHHLGAKGLGVIGLVVLGISLIGLAANLVGGGALVYLVPRAPLKRLILPAYAWAVTLSIIGYLVVEVFDLVPEGYAGHVAVLALVQSIYNIHLSVLIGQGRIRTHNFITVLQAGVLLVVFALLLRTGPHDPMAFVKASYVAFTLTLLLSTVAMRAIAPRLPYAGGAVFRMLLRQGAYVQSANAMQLLNYRAAYWLIERFHGTPLLGVYTIATQLSESAWLAPKSLGLILYSRVSNTADPAEQRMLTLTLLKASVGSALAVVIVFLLLPGTVFSWAFGKEIVGLFPVMALLAPGILAMAASQAFSHFFSGTGRNRHNVTGSGLGLLATAVAGFTLVPVFGLEGAAVTATLAYGANALYQTIAFIRITDARWHELLPSRADVARLKRLLTSRAAGTPR